METPLPLGWKPLHIDLYDGTMHLDEHIDLYVTQVNLYTNDDAVLCRVFLTSLKGAALGWYTQLPARSIDSFDTLVRQFMTQYATSRPHHITSTTLASLRQSNDEPLRTFMERFASISVKIQNLNPEVRGKSQVKLDQGHKDKVKVTNDSQFKKAARASKGGRYDFYTPLNAPRVHILKEASNSNLLSLPPLGHSSNSADKSKHYRYHRNHGHTTEECRTLRDRIEELVQAGHLTQYVQRQQGHRGGYNGRGRGRGRSLGTRIDQPSGSQQNGGGTV
ncbi:uncharacterized protein LOC109794101 [Cajanus cajan]|uniref:uncharacterized protein LOC109794101 n=1 Tax=Cajanus cajan TaxID=3821 RepID=UPI00098DA237|nr:uncharacterized protein LOC109794101 [Cajanus cajan]